MAKKPGIPQATNLQVFLLQQLINGEKSGKELRQLLADNGAKKSGPGFYQIMSRLEDDGLVDPRWKNIEVNGHKVRERRYKITGGGRSVVRSVRDFVTSIGLMGAV